MRALPLCSAELENGLGALVNGSLLERASEVPSGDGSNNVDSDGSASESLGDGGSVFSVPDACVWGVSSLEIP